MRFIEAEKAVLERGMFGGEPGVFLSSRLLEHLEYPKQKLIHIAGTNGKGSTALFTAYFLARAGYRVGLLTSPHLVSVCERIRIMWAETGARQSFNAAASEENHPETVVLEREISGEDFAALCDQVFEADRRAGGDAAASDFLLAVSVLYFNQENCDYIVIETGLGGRLDSTNALAMHHPAVVSCITRIGEDHTALLGSDIEEIAAEKAGIIQPGTQAVVAAEMDIRALEVVRSRCKECGTRCIEVTRNDNLGKETGGVYLNAADDWILQHAPRLYPTYQRENLKNALAIVGALGERLPLHFGTIRLPQNRGRMELICVSKAAEHTDQQEMWLVADGAHNPQGAAAFAKSLRQRYPGLRFCGIVGILRDKDAKGILEPFFGLLSSVIIVETGEGSRRTDGRALAKTADEMGFRAMCCANLKDAIERLPDVCDGEGSDAFQNDLPCKSKQDAVPRAVLFGSLTLIGELKRYAI